MRHPRPVSARNGFIIIAALWIIAALATLASIYSVYVARSAMALGVNDERVETDQLVTAALELAAYQMSSAAPAARPTKGAFRFRLAGAEVAVEFMSEAARIDLNAARKTMIAGLFAALGAKPDAAAAYAERVVGWRTPPKPDAPDSEASLYRAAGLPYGPRGAPFDHVAELWLVHGLPPALVERALPFVTVHSGQSDVNVLDAPPEVIAALPGMTPARLDAFLRQRDRLASAPQFVAGALGGNQIGATTRGSSAVRVRTGITLASGRRTVSDVVIQLGGATNPYEILSWQDDVDPMTGAPPSPVEAR
ncbi:general secretion pathway protein GspK [Blastochloris tepida]|uniref:T2SS protein K first SAM-like domain-containing protein n=1 Tax=Blastochloris tepida TaxID=2233851 RepID=A0A348G0S5_9HYPH|nr:type II secretion system protein GspK [Blastochloris tepida]BBF93158.1 hypothetical protein BLTE_18430 [Blastochloris tepida]